MLELINYDDLIFQENEVINQTEENFSESLNIHKDAMNIYSELLKILMEEINKSTSKFENYSFIQFYRNFYSVKAIYNLIKTGFYFDAMSLLRPWLESIANIIFFSRNQQYIDSVITDPEKFARKFPVSKRFKDTNFNEGYTDYQNLCRFSHGATLNIIAVFSASQEMDLLPYGIVYQEKDATLTMYLFTRFLGMSLDLLKTIFKKTFLIKEELINKCEEAFSKLTYEKEKLGKQLLKFKDQYLKQYNVKI